MRSISSPTLIAREFISYARWAVIRLTSSVTICTLDFSRKPDWIAPKPFSPAVPVVGVVPTTYAVPAAVVTLTPPSFPISMETASVGMLMAGSMG